MAREFVLVRLDKITGADLNVFEFDYDLTWMAFFVNADDNVYGRYGGRDAADPEARLSLTGMRYAMQRALAAHQRDPNARPAEKRQRFRVEDYRAAQRIRRGECIHCHQVYEARRSDLQAAGKWKKDEVWVYPLPENVGLTLDVDQGDRVKSVKAGSPAEKAGVRAGDVLEKLNGVSVAATADVMYALHRAPAKGKIPLTWQRDGKSLSAELEVAEGWRKTNPTWRPSMLDILPSLTVYGEDLTPAEKKALNLPEKRLAFRQENIVHSEARALGVQAGDVIVGIDNEKLDMNMREFLGYVRRNYLRGDSITLNVLRSGKAVELTGKLK